MNHLKEVFIFHLKLYDNNNSAIVLLKRFSLCFCIAEDATTLKLEDDLNAEETSSEDEDELPHEGRWLKDLWERDEKEESWDEDEGSNEDSNEQEGDDDDEDEDEDSNEGEHEQEGDDDDDEDEAPNQDEDEHEHEGDEDRDEMK